MIKFKTLEKRKKIPFLKDNKGLGTIFIKRSDSFLISLYNPFLVTVNIEILVNSKTIENIKLPSYCREEFVDFSFSLESNNIEIKYSYEYTCSSVPDSPGPIYFPPYPSPFPCAPFVITCNNSDLSGTAIVNNLNQHLAHTTSTTSYYRTSSTVQVLLYSIFIKIFENKFGSLK